MLGIDNSFLSIVVSTVTIVGGLATIAGVLLYTNQNKLLYMPNPPGVPKTPDENPEGDHLQ